MLQDPPPPRFVDAKSKASALPLPSFSDVYRRFAPVAHGIALAHVGPDDADDVTQEVFLRVAKSLSTLRDPAALPGWVCALARNAARDRLRERKRRASPQAIESDSLPARPERADDRELRTRVLARLAEVPETFREALVLRLVEGLDGPAIAALLGLTPGSVRVHLHRGLALLRPLLTKEGW